MNSIPHKDMIQVHLPREQHPHADDTTPPTVEAVRYVPNRAERRRKRKPKRQA